VAEELAQDTGLPLSTEMVGTSRGGLHLALAADAPVEFRALYLEGGHKLGELKAARAYVVVPPSTIGNRPYQRLSPDGLRPLKVEDPTEWLRKLLSGFGFSLALTGMPRRLRGIAPNASSKGADRLLRRAKRAASIEVSRRGHP
jgi:hypothetical protein